LKEFVPAGNPRYQTFVILKKPLHQQQKGGLWQIPTIKNDGNIGYYREGCQGKYATEAIFSSSGKMREHRFDTADLDYNEFVVALKTELIGLGRIKRQVLFTRWVVSWCSRRKRGEGSEN
jgi:hypothetical protein